MASELVWAHIFLLSAVAAAAGFGASRCWRLLRYGRDPRLLKLMWFYGLFAASLVSVAIWTGQLAMLGDTSTRPHSGSILLVAHHGLMLASLGVAVQAFSQRRTKSAAVAAVGVAALAAEAAMTLYLAVHALLNYMERRSPGALQVAAGFLLFFAGYVSIFLFYDPGAVWTSLGDLLALVGIVLLVQLLPRPST